MKELNFVFEDFEKCENFTKCKDLNASGLPRFHTSPVYTRLHRKFWDHWRNKVDFKVECYRNTRSKDIEIISTGVAHCPEDWCGYVDIGKRYDDKMRKTNSILYYLEKHQLLRLQNKTSFLLIDQTHEGYHTDWLFEWFHDMCIMYNVSPEQIIYVTGDLDVNEKYDIWCNENNIVEKVHMLGYAHFEYSIYTESHNVIRQTGKSFNFARQIIHKKKHKDSIFLYNCLQKRPRGHRNLMFKELYFNDLIKDGIVSTNRFDLIQTWYFNKMMAEEDYNQFIDLLPMFPPSDTTTEDQSKFESSSGVGYISKLNDDVMFNSWISVVSEATFAENECFLSEKSFKPIACSHPFIIYGNKGSLKRLHEMGYKTFDKWWDESYDMQPAEQRIKSIIQILKDLQKLNQNQLQQMFFEMRSVLSHNLSTLHKRSLSVDDIAHTIIDIVN